jgi:hypothetical protein
VAQHEWKGYRKPLSLDSDIGMAYTHRMNPHSDLTGSRFGELQFLDVERLSGFSHYGCPDTHCTSS